MAVGPLTGALAQASVQDFWAENGDAVEKLLVFAGGILLYALVVNFFYQIISKRVMLGAKEQNGRTSVGGPGRGFVYLMAFPLLSFAFFLVLSMALSFLSKDADPVQVLTLAMAIVAAVRMAAYFSESASHDLAKMLPLGLLGVFLVQFNPVDLMDAADTVTGIFDHSGLLLLYLGIVVVLEYVLRTVYLIVRALRGGKRGKARDPDVQTAAR